jgi:hypothetical protein
MNPDLYTDEFRNFKYLKSSGEDVSFYKKNFTDINQVQPWADVNDPNYVWPNRLEFIEQLIDLQGETVYVVEPSELRPGKLFGTSEYSNAILHVIEESIVYRGNPLMFKSPPATKMEDIQDIESQDHLFYLCKKDSKDHIVKVSHLGILPNSGESYIAVFNNFETAEKYRIAITQFLRSRNDAVSAISRLF